MFFLRSTVFERSDPRAGKRCAFLRCHFSIDRRWGTLAGHIPASKAGQEYPDHKNNPKRAMWSKQSQLGFKLPPVHPDQGRWLEAICAGIAVKVIDRELTAEQAAAEAQKQLDEVLPYY